MNPKMEGFSYPAEWVPQQAVWTAWPAEEEWWQENLEPAQDEFVEFCQLIHRGGAKLCIAVPNDAALKQAKSRLSGLNVQLEKMSYGDIWFRDSLPLFLTNEKGEVRKVRFIFNGWGEKYDMPGDSEVGDLVCERSPGQTYRADWVLEGGSIEADGEGTILTSKQCLLNPNRNPNLSQADLEARLKKDLGAEKILWLGDGLLNDHTDGHIDTMARFVKPGEVVVMRPCSEIDPNKKLLEAMIRDLENMVDARGRKLKVHTVASPGSIMNDGDLMPASYMNFLITNQMVIVPIYGSPQDEAAVRDLQKLFPKHEVVGAKAKFILTGGGAFHCITQQIPKGHFA